MPAHVPSDGCIDVHCAAGVVPGFDFTAPEPLIAAMEAHGVAHAVLGPIGAWAAVEHERGDDVLREWCRRWPGRFSRWVTVNPWRSDAQDRLVRALDDTAAGLKLIPAVQGFSLLQQALVAPLLDVARGAGVPVYVVTGVPVAAEPFQLTELARRNPDVTFVLGRSGRTDFALDLLPALLAVDNVVAETAYNGPSLIRQLADELPPGRLVFASDAPFNDLDLELDRVERAGLPPDVRSDVLSGAAEHLLSRERTGRAA